MNAIAPADSVLRLTDADILRATSRGPFMRGREYADRHRCTVTRHTADGTLVEAETRGSQPQPYRQRITLRASPRGLVLVEGSCSCPVGSNCKHVAAALITVCRMVRGFGPRRDEGEVSASTPAREEPLPSAIAAWLGAMEDAAGDNEDYPPTVRNRIIYVLGGAADRLTITPMVVGLTRDDELNAGSARPYQLHQIANPEQPRYLRPSDRQLLQWLHRGANADTGWIGRLLAAGRARWGGVDGPLVGHGPPRPGRLAWRLGEDGSQAPIVEADGVLAMRAPAPCYFDPNSASLGALTLELPDAVSRALLAAPAVAASQVARVRAEMQKRLGAHALPAPALLDPPQIISTRPTPHLRLFTARIPEPYAWRADSRGVETPVARLSFRYGPVLIANEVRAEVFVREGRLFTIKRNDKTERRCWKYLDELGFTALERARPGIYNHPNRRDLLLDDLDGSAWLMFLIAGVPTLREAGWEIEIAPDFPIRVEVPDDEDVRAELSEGSGIDWLELQLGVMVDGERVDLVAPILALLGRAGNDFAGQLTAAEDHLPLPLPLDGGRVLVLTVGRLRPILLALIELFARAGGMPGEGKVRFTRHDAADLAALEQAAPDLAWQGGEALRTLGRRLREAGGTIVPATVPAGFAATLRPYQAHGVGWLQLLREAGLGGVLADDMGLGKTVQALAHIAIEKAEGRLDCPALIVCPTSLVPNWSHEIARFAPGMRVLPLHGLARKQRFDEITAHDAVITTYKLLARDAEVLTAHEWHIVVLDEAQAIKNPAAETTRLAVQLKANQRICLSGTPLENHLGELWSLFNFAATGFLGSREEFRRRWRQPIEKRGDEAKRAHLAARIRPFVLRRTKEQVAADLPAKTEMVEPVELEPGQRTIYESVRLAMHKRVREAIAARGLAQSGIVILDALLKMRQACCDPRLLKLEAVKHAKAGSAKLDRLMELLEVLLSEGRRVLVFSQFTSMLALIEARLSEAKIGYVQLTGDTKDRQAPIARFQGGEVPLFLLSLKAGGTGLNLTAADTVIHYDPWWNPAVENQATDRAHRIGQDKPVFVHRLVTTDSIEEKMEALKSRKRALVAGILGDGAGAAPPLTEADVEALFG